MKYKIKEISELTGLSAHTIRYYEKEGILPPINRDKNGIRFFSEDNLFWIDLVTCLKNTRLPVSEIKKIVQLSQMGDSTISDRKEILENYKSNIELQIKELIKSKKKIEKKIAFYNGEGEC